MIKYKVHKGNKEYLVSLQVSQANVREQITIEGDTDGEFSDWLYYEHGKYGHLITDTTTGMDLDSALAKQEEYEIELIEGSKLISLFKDPTPSNRIT